jgi:arsenate reductase-like glutaredoxin family protein
MENFNYICHIINLNMKNKKKFLDEIKNDFNIIDLDKINNNIISDDKLDRLYQKYEKLKNSKNDKYKELDKQITQFWENNFKEKVLEESSKTKKNIFIGSNYHYKNISKKINLYTCNNFIVSSDRTIKENITEARKSYIDDLTKLQVVNYNYIADETKSKKLGFIAQDVEKIFPSIITEDKGVKGISYSALVPMLVSAIQSLKQEVDTLKLLISSTR